MTDKFFEEKKTLFKHASPHKPKRKRVPNPGSKSLNLLAQYVRRGKLISEARKKIKTVLEEKGMSATEEVLQIARIPARS
ncbi:MAG TPA: hypothetical protein DD719_06025 [Desulfotomaculum sp.]|nr:hypothetical protein [Desulfotomaculum sp.]